MAVELYQRKNGLFALTCFSIQPMAPAVISSSTVSMRFLVKGAGVFNGLLAYAAPARIDVASSLSVAKQWRTPRGPNRFRNSGFLG